MLNIRDHFARIFYKLYSMSCPDVFYPTEQDVFLVSYPRSGNTWMRVVLSELLYGKSGSSLKDIEYYIPDIHIRPLKRDVVKADFHVVKSHSLYLRTEMTNFKRIVYLVRDPRDVVLSHYRYMSGHGYLNNFDEFLIDWLTGRIWPTSWREHINSWTGIGIETNSVNICIIRYEDLLLDPVNQVQKIMNFIGFEKDINLIQKAIEFASVENMRKKEKLGLREDQNVKGLKFIGEAISGQWKNKLNNDQIELIEKFSKIEMKKHGYIR